MIFFIVVIIILGWSPWLQRTDVSVSECGKAEKLHSIYYSEWIPFGRTYRTCFGDWYAQAFFGLRIKVCSGDGSANDVCT